MSGSAPPPALPVPLPIVGPPPRPLAITAPAQRPLMPVSGAPGAVTVNSPSTTAQLQARRAPAPHYSISWGNSTLTRR